MIITHDKTVLKEKIHQASIRKQRSLIDDFKTRIANLLTPHGLGNEEEYDNNIMSQNSEQVDEAEALNAALEFANQEMQTLLLLPLRTDSNSNVASGAVVVTNNKRFYVSTSVEEIDVDGEKYVGISTSSQLYQAMKRKKTGQTFSYAGITYTILEIF